MTSLSPLSSAPATALVAGLAFVAGLGLLGSQLATLRQSGIVTVRGAAEMPVEADVATWRLSLSETGNDLAQTQQTFTQHLQAMRTFLEANGLKADDIENQTVQVSDADTNQYREGTVKARFNVMGGVLVRTADLKAIQKAKNNLAQLLQSGVVISGNDGPNYGFSGLSDAKPELVSKATQEARKAAQQFAAGNAVTLKRMVNARQGSVEILGRDTFLSEPEQVHKILRVVTTVDYQVE